MTQKLIIFDCDGVLIDSEYISSKVFAEALTAWGYPLSTEESIRRFTGVNAHEAREAILQEASSLDIPENYWELQQPNLLKAYQNELSPLVQPVLEKLRELQARCCVASNSTKKYIFNCLQLTNLDPYFGSTAIFTAEQVPRPKPAPDLFLYAAQEMGVKPENCLVIEDSAAGTQAAVAAGMPVINFLGGSHAGFEWYGQNLHAFGVPAAKDCHELLQAIIAFLKQ